MRFGPKKRGERLKIEDLFTDRVEQQERWKQLLSAKAGEPLPVQFYYGVSGEGKTYLRRQFGRIAESWAGIPCVSLDLDKMGIGREGPDRAALVLRLVNELEMEAPRVQLAILYIAMEEAKGAIDGRELARELAANALGAAADAFLQSIQGQVASIGIGGFLGAIAKAGWQAYQRAKEPLTRYLGQEEGQLDKAELQSLETLEEIKSTLFDRFAQDLYLHRQPGT